MNWKIFIPYLIELGLVLFPANIIGCSDPPDPFDDYITFFRSDVAPARAYAPFYYVENSVMFNPLSPAAHNRDRNARMWVRYCRGAVSFGDADRLVNKSSAGELASLYSYLQKAPMAGTTPVGGNKMAAYLIGRHDLEAAKYLCLAKRAEAYTATVGNVQDSWGGWVMQPKDSIGMATLIAAALQGNAGSKNGFIRARYGFLAERLAFYDRHYLDCIHYYDIMVKGNPRSGDLAIEGLDYKGGALLHTGKRLDAAYVFSRCFSAFPNSSDYMSFGWCVRRFEDSDRRACLARCGNNREKAEMLGLFLLGSNAPEKAALTKIYRLAHGTPVQEVLAVREVNKIERNYLTPLLTQQKGGKAINDLSWSPEGEEGDQWLEEARDLIPFYSQIAFDSGVAHPGLFATVAAQLCYISRQYSRGDSILDRAGVMPAGSKLREQQRMTKLLLTINEREVVDRGFEQDLLPSIRWLGQKALRDSNLTAPSEMGDKHLGLWRQIYRNLLSEVLAKRYEQQKDRSRETLCIGVAERMEGSNLTTENFIRNELTTTELIRLLGQLESTGSSDWDKYLVSRFPVPVDEVRQAIAVAQIREHHFHSALAWMKKIKGGDLMNLQRNPFADLMSDNQDSLFPFDKGHFDKRSFVGEMALLMDKERARDATARDLYRLATGYYNMTYYGRAWETVRYDRSGNETDDMPGNPTDFDRDYYGCYTAEAYYQKAMAESANREFRARCLFMMAKCSQKQVSWPGYATADWDQANHEFLLRFRHNRHFPQLVEQYGNTGFYREAFNTCSYLSDFVRGK